MTEPSTSTKQRTLFSRRHYTFVAAHLADMQRRNVVTRDEWLTHVMQMGTIFKKDNPNFIIARFMQACGMSRGQANRALEGHMDE